MVPEREVRILQIMEKSMLRAMYGIQLKDRQRSKDLTLMLGLNEAIDQLAMASSVRWYGQVLRQRYDLVLRRTQDFYVGSQRIKAVMYCIVVVQVNIFM